MNSKSIAVADALKLLKAGEKIEELTIEFKEGERIKALDAFRLGKAGIEVPDDAIEYNDADVVNDPDFDDYEWKRVDMDPVKPIKERLTVNIEVEKDVKAWIQKNGIEIDILVEKLVYDFYSASQMIK